VSSAITYHRPTQRNAGERTADKFFQKPKAAIAYHVIGSFPDISLLM